VERNSAEAVFRVVDAFAPLDVIDRFLAIVGRVEDDSQS
jgi:hypothetical protein